MDDPISLHLHHSRATASHLHSTMRFCTDSADVRSRAGRRVHIGGETRCGDFQVRKVPGLADPSSPMLNSGERRLWRWRCAHGRGTSGIRASSRDGPQHSGVRSACAPLYSSSVSVNARWLVSAEKMSTVPLEPPTAMVFAPSDRRLTARPSADGDEQVARVSSSPVRAQR